MFCNYCRMRLPEDALFCNKCGKQQKEVVNTPAPAEMISSPVPQSMYIEAAPSQLSPVHADAQESREPVTLLSQNDSVDSSAITGSPTNPQMEVATISHQTMLSTEMTRSSTPPQVARPDTKAPMKPAKRNTSRRLVLLGLTCLVIIALVTGGIVWLNLLHTTTIKGITEFILPTHQFNWAGEIVSGPDGNLWFTETHENRIGRITPSGSITEFSIPTTQVLNGIAMEVLTGGIAVGPDGNLWFTEENKFGRITPSGTITEFPLSTSGSVPSGITGGPDGNLWFTEVTIQQNNIIGSNIGRMSTSGSITEFPLPTDNSGPGSITTGPDGNLWFTEANKIGRITPSGSITEFPVPTSQSDLDSITTGPDGNLWFTELMGNKIGRITPSGTITEYSIPTRNSQPAGITTGPDGNLWFAENRDTKIGRISPNGTITEFPIPASLGDPGGIVAGPNGTLWFTTDAGYIGRIVIADFVTANLD